MEPASNKLTQLNSTTRQAAPQAQTNTSAERQESGSSVNMLRPLWRLRVPAGRGAAYSAAGGGDGRKKVIDRAGVQAAADRQRADDQARQMAQWVSSWMMPWERAQMDASVKPLKTWERVYWRLFLVFGTVGFAYETYVLGNRRVLRMADVDSRVTAPATSTTSSSDRLYRSNNAFRSHHLMSDAEANGEPSACDVAMGWGTTGDAESKM